MPAPPARRAAVLALLGGLGCSHDSPPPPKPASGPVITVLEPGAEPLAALRYAFTVGSEQRLTLALHLGMQIDAKGSPFPPVAAPGLRLTIALQVSEAAGESGAHCQLTVTDADLIDVDEAQPAMLAEMRKNLPALVGARGSAVVDGLGVVHQAGLDVPGGLGAEMQEYLGAIQLALAHLSVPLPDPPIGIGAKWEVSETIQQSTMRVKQKALYELSALEGGRAALHLQIVQTGEPQDVNLPGLPAGVSTEIVSLSSAGSGQLEIDLARPGPVSQRIEIETGVSFRIRQGDKQQAMALTSDTRLEIESL